MRPNVCSILCSRKRHSYAQSRTPIPSWHLAAAHYYYTSHIRYSNLLFENANLCYRHTDIKVKFPLCLMHIHYTAKCGCGCIVPSSKWTGFVCETLSLPLTALTLTVTRHTVPLSLARPIYHPGLRYFPPYFGALPIFQLP